MNPYIIVFFIALVYMIFIYKKKKKSYHRTHLIPKYRKMAKEQNKTLVHFIHIGKTGGTAVKHAIGIKGKAYIDTKQIIIGHKHSFSLEDIPVGEKCFFFLRDPIDKFISAFYSRKRKGMPRIYHEWNKEEKKAFSSFSTANELAKALDSEDKKEKNNAADAMNSINHIRSSYWDWFVDKNYFLNRKSDIIFIGNQKQLNADFIKLKNILDLPDHLHLPSDPVKMHKNPEKIDKHLDDQSIKNLKLWYAKDYEFLDIASSLD